MCILNGFIRAPVQALLCLRACPYRSGKSVRACLCRSCIDPAWECLQGWLIQTAIFRHEIYSIGQQHLYESHHTAIALRDDHSVRIERKTEKKKLYCFKEVLL